jgi:hypothetical protein
MRDSWPLLLVVAVGCSSKPHAPVGERVGDAGKSPVVVMVDRTPVKPPRADRKDIVFIDEKEPDDDIAHAQPLELPKGVHGTVGPPLAAGKSLRSDEDNYQWLVAAEEKQSARIELSGVPGVTLALDALDGDGKKIATADGGGEGEAQVMPNLVVEPGKTYFLRVRAIAKKRNEPAAADPTHPYSLVVLAAPLAPGEEVEPNDTAAQANPLAADANGFFGRRRDEDWLALGTDGVQPGSSTVRLELSAVDGVAPMIRILDGSGAVLVESKGGKGDELRLRNAPTAAATMVQLRADSGYDTENRWTLRAQVEPALPTGAGGAEKEPNGTRDTATAVACAVGAPAATVSGFLWPGDADVFLVHAEGRALLRADLETPEKIDLKLELLGDGTAALVKADDGGVGKSEAIPTWSTPGGDLFLRVTGRPKDSAFDVPYRLSVALATDDGSSEREPNNAAPNATVIEAGKAMRGFIAPRGDEDWFKITAPDGATTVKATVEGGPGKALAVKLTDETKAPLGPGSGATQSAPVQGGKSYFVVVRDPSGKASSTSDSYTLTVTF